MKNIILGILGIGGLAGIAYLFTSFINKKSDILETVHKITQDIGKKKVEVIEKKQIIVKQKIEEDERLSEQTKKEIVEIKKKANEEIKEILVKDNFRELAKEADELW